eukprot:SAG11_NODE_26151_length_349_cov_0.760000_1_plen_63_part_10
MLIPGCQLQAAASVGTVLGAKELKAHTEMEINAYLTSLVAFAIAFGFVLLAEQVVPLCSPLHA